MSNPKIFCWLLNDRYYFAHTEFTGRKGDTIAGYILQKCYKDKQTGKILPAKGSVWMKDMEAIKEVRDALTNFLDGKFTEPSPEQPEDENAPF